MVGHLHRHLLILERGRRRRSAVVARAVLAVALGIGAAAPVSAHTGVAINLGLVAVQERLYPGQSYRLPELVVRNPGDEAGGAAGWMRQPMRPGWSAGRGRLIRCGRLRASPAWPSMWRTLCCCG